MGGGGSYFWSFSLEEEEEDGLLRLLQGGSSRCSLPPGAAGRGAERGARRLLREGGKSPLPKSLCREAITFPGWLQPRGGWCRINPPLPAGFLFNFFGRSASLSLSFAPHRMPPPRAAKSVVFFALHPSATKFPRPAPKTPGDGARNTAQRVRVKPTFKTLATGSVSTGK